MSRILSRAALALLMTVAACEDEPLSPMSAASGETEAVITGRDRAAIREIVHTFDEAWTAGDPVRYAAQYAHVTDFVGPNGNVLTSHAAITELYTALFTFVFPNTTRHSYIRNLTFFGNRTAVLDIDTRLRGIKSLPPGVVTWRPGVARALEKNVLVKRGDEWRIVLHQQTLLAPEQ
jgi:uncharacterized protein (TIGR02246 family)